MDGPSLIVAGIPIVILIALFSGIALPFIAGSQPSRSHAPVEYLYVPCVRIGYHGHPAQTRRWVQQVPIVKKTAKWIYYASDTWDRNQAVVSPGRISREGFENDTRRRDDRHRPGPAGRRFFATREAAEAELSREEGQRAGQAAWEASPIKELRRAMADAHPDRGGTTEQFIDARRRYQAALPPAPGHPLGTYTDVTGTQVADCERREARNGMV
jgi:hypothetical protein